MPEPTTLANGVLPGAGYVHLDRPVPAPCIITLSPDTAYWEKVPVYRCTDDGPYVALLGVENPHGHPLVVQLKQAHSAGGAVRVEVVDAMQPEDEVWKTAPGLAQQIRDRLDGLSPEHGVAIEFPAVTTAEYVERWREACLRIAGRAPWTMQIADGPKVYPGFEMMRDALLAVIALDQQFRDFGPITLPDTDDGRRRYYMHAGAQEGLELAMTAIATSLGIEADDG